MEKEPKKTDLDRERAGSSSSSSGAIYSPEEYQDLLDERDDLRNRYQRALADYQNAQRRFSSDLIASRQTGIEKVLGELIPVLDHFDMALNQDTSSLSIEQFAQGVEIIRHELSKALAAFDVQQIQPTPNDPFDPSRHEALSQLAGEGIQEGHISSVYQPGYAIGTRIIRPAKVTIAPGKFADSPDNPSDILSED